MQPYFTFFFGAVAVAPGPPTGPPSSNPELLPDGVLFVAEEVLTEVVPMFTGDAPVYHTDPNTEGRITIRQTQPYPMTVLALFGELEFGEFS